VNQAAGDDSWEKFMQIGGDAGLEIRVPVTAGPHVVGVSFAGRCGAGRPSAAIAKEAGSSRRPVYMDTRTWAKSNRRSLQEFWTGEDGSVLGHAEPSRDFVCQPKVLPRAGVRFEDPFKNGRLA